MSSPGITKADGFPFCIAQTTRKIFLCTVKFSLRQIKQHPVKVYDRVAVQLHTCFTWRLAVTFMPHLFYLCGRTVRRLGELRSLSGRSAVEPNPGLLVRSVSAYKFLVGIWRKESTWKTGGNMGAILLDSRERGLGGVVDWSQVVQNWAEWQLY